MITMINYKSKVFKDRLDLLMYFVESNDNALPEKLFPPSDFYFMASALKEKFNRDFKVEEIIEIYKDKSWQWRKPLQIELEKA